MAEERETFMPLAELNTPGRQALPKVKPDLCRVGGRVVALYKGIERRGTITYVRNFNAMVRPDDGGHTFKVNLRDLLRKAPPEGEQGYRGNVVVSHRHCGRKVSFHMVATTTASDQDAAHKRLMEGARLMFPVSCERVVDGVASDPDVVG